MPKATNCEYSEPSIDDKLDFVLYEKEDTPESTSYSHRVRSLEDEACPQCFSGTMQPISFKSAQMCWFLKLTQEISKLVKL
jgi:hypothetical protein